jgi:hypothetical protein
LLEKKENIQINGGEGLLKPWDENPWHIKCINYNFELHITKVRNIFERIIVLLPIYPPE